MKGYISYGYKTEEVDILAFNGDSHVLIIHDLVVKQYRYPMVYQGRDMIYPIDPYKLNLPEYEFVD